LRDAVRLADDARAAHRELDRLSAEAERVEHTFERAWGELEPLEARLGALGAGDALRGAERVGERRSARARASELHAELLRTHPDPERLVADAGPPAGGEGVDEVPRLVAREQSLTEQVEELARRAQALGKDVEHLADRETLDDLDGEIRSLEEERRALVQRRDRLWVLARVVRDAERWVRENHQPEVLRRAGAHLATLTAGRYDRLLLGGETGRTFVVRGPAVAAPTPVAPPLSTGTREQIYLALRLALLDALDHTGERMPLLLDEVLVNWDSLRRARGLDLLADLARSRQVLLLTCHAGLAREAGSHGAHLIELSGP
jgi:uncharacterized protein YhaN